MILTDHQVKAAIVQFLVMKGRWGAHYFPVDTLVNWMGRKIQKNGRRVRANLKELAKEGYILMHKRGETASLNSAMTEKTRELIEKFSG